MICDFASVTFAVSDSDVGPRVGPELLRIEYILNCNLTK